MAAASTSPPGQGPDWVRRAAVGAFAVAVLVIGVVAHGDFGVSWDEPEYYRYGELTQRFYESGDRSFETYSNLRYYGPVVPLLHSAVADVVQPSSTTAIPLAHLVNYLIFAAGLAAFYRLLLLHTRTWGWALLGAAFLLLSPRIFSHAFVNPKDSPFLALLIITVYLLVRFLETRQRWLLPPLAVASGLLVDIRVIGLVVVAMVLTGLALDALAARDRALEHFVRPAWTYLVLVVPVTVALWPFLWPDPLDRFGQALAVMSQFDVGPQTNLYMGELISKQALPWHYIPVWILVTTPITYIALALVGLVATLRSSPLRLYAERSADRHYFLYAAWLLGPPLLVIARGSPLYDEWRHVNFVYPALIIFAVAGAQAISGWLGRVLRSQLAPTIFVVGVSASAVAVGVTMIQLHPYQAVYFNRLAGGTDGASDRYDLDYWGLSYREGLDFLLERHPEGTLRVHACTTPGELNAVLFEQRDRLRFVDDAGDADYGICAPRGIVLGPDGDPPHGDEHRTVFSVRRDGAEILYVKDLGEERS